MWDDIGLGDWLFDLDDETQVQGIVPAVLDLARKPNAAKASQASQFVLDRQRQTMEQLRDTLAAGN